MEHEQMGLNKKQKSSSNQNARKTYFRIKSAGNARPEKMQIKFRPNQKGFGNRGGGGYKNKRQQNSEQIETIYAPSRGGKKKGDKNSINKILLNDALMIQKANKFSKNSLNNCELNISLLKLIPWNSAEGISEDSQNI